MKIISELQWRGITPPPPGFDTARTVCPFCSPWRQKRDERCARVTITSSAKEKLYTASRDFELTDGKHTFGTGSVRYTFTITEGSSPEEDPSCDIMTTEVCMNYRDYWHPVKGDLLEMLEAVSDEWLIEHAMESEDQ